MIPTAIGLPTSRANDTTWNKAQDWLHDHSLTPYMPQLRHSLSYNIAQQYVNGILNWSPAMIAETKRFAHPLVFNYSKYWYKTRPAALSWEGNRQDDLTLAHLTTYLAATLAWFRRQGIDPWIMVDEPPQPSAYGKGDDPFHWGWTQEVETRIIKFVDAAVEANWTVGVAMPGPQQLNYWRPRIHPTRWILHDGRNTPWPALSGDIWLYNAEIITGLGARMKALHATGYLHWHATEAKPPLLVVNDTKGTVIATLQGLELVQELAGTAEPPTLQEQLDALTARVVTLEALSHAPH